MTTKIGVFCSTVVSSLLSSVTAQSLCIRKRRVETENDLETKTLPTNSSRGSRHPPTLLYLLHYLWNIYVL